MRACGGGFAIIHTVGIVVGHEVVAGDNLVLYQGVTLGHTGTGEGQPRIGHNVRIGAGAKVLGPVVVGDGAWIGANAVVLTDVPAGAVATGVWRGTGRGLRPRWRPSDGVLGAGTHQRNVTARSSLTVTPR